VVKPKYKRVLLKISGEALEGKSGYGIDTNVLEAIALQIKEIISLGVEVAIVIGGGNVFRGFQATIEKGMDRVTADYMGMLATVLNGLALQDAMERAKIFTRVQTAIEMEELAEPFIRRRAIRHLEKKRAVIFVAGTGNPYFTTDTASALRATEISADVILKATKVDGIYSKDPVKDKNAKRYTKLRYIDVIKKGLKIMDATAVTLCMENKLPIIVFNMNKKGNIKRAILGENVGTIVS